MEGLVIHAAPRERGRLPDRGFWAGRRVFLTGHTGFKGGWLALWLARLGAEVQGFALEPETSPNLFDAARLGEVLQDGRGDVQDYRALHASLGRFRPEVVIHMAAQPLVRASYADPLGTYQTNVMGTAHLLEAIRAVPTVAAVVCVTTDKVYENREREQPYVEGDALGGFDPYSSSKACAELVAAAYRQSFLADAGCHVATARAGNVIGGGDWSPDRLLPDLLRGFARGETVAIRRPGSVRPWQHVLEPLCGYLLLAEDLYRRVPATAGAYNFGPATADAWPVGRVVEAVAHLWGPAARWSLEPVSGLHEAGLLHLDASLAMRDLQWHPRLGVQTALEWVLHWDNAFRSGEDAQALTLRQIAEYEALPVARPVALLSA